MFNKLRYMVEKNFELNRSFDNKKDISREELKKFLKVNTIIIDVRSPQEYREGHIKGAISIPEYQIKKDIQKYVQNKNKLIVLYCSTGHRSQRAQRILENMGYTNVFNIYGGINEFNV